MNSLGMNTNVYKNYHCLKTEMPSDVLDLFKANEVHQIIFYNVLLDWIFETNEKTEVQIPRSCSVSNSNHKLAPSFKG